MGIARDQPGSHALGKDEVEQVLEYSRQIQLARATNGGLLGQALIDLVAQKI
jgi:hypothetical protein